VSIRYGGFLTYAMPSLGIGFRWETRAGSGGKVQAGLMQSIGNNA